jgi:hypothetical protein
MLSPEQRTMTLHQLAQRIASAGLLTPALVTLDALQPVDVISSQFALFLRPFIVRSGFDRYAEALALEHGWQELRTMLRELEGSERGN